jgi:transcriptional regulator with XRE-family HTH domain
MNAAPHSRAANRLRALRAERGLTQAQLAEASGVALHTVVRLDGNPAARPALDVALKLSAALDVPIGALLPECEPATPVAISA